MKASTFDFLGNLDTLIAVVIGAVLATGGALIAEIIQDRLGRKRRQRDAARFFGEVMTSIDAIIDLAVSSQKIGDPWGRVTQRMFETALREAVVYERNRERLFDIADMPLRFAIHAHFLRETTPIVAIIEQSETIDDIRRKLEESDLSDARRATLEAELQQELSDRALSLEATLYRRARTPELIERLSKLAKADFKLDYSSDAEDDEDNVADTADANSQAPHPE